MKVTINKDGKSATDNKGKTYIVNGIELRPIEKGSPIFYEADSHFFRTACPSNTEHNFTILDSGKINLH